MRVIDQILRAGNESERDAGADECSDVGMALDTVDTEAVMEETAEKADDLGEVYAAMEALVDLYHTSIAAGGMTQKEAGYLSYSRDMLNNMAGLSGAKIGTEGYGQGDQLAATRAGVESMVDSAKKVWDKIIEMIKKSIAAVVEFFRNIFGMSERMLRRAEALKGKIDTGKKLGKQSIKTLTLSNRIRTVDADPDYVKLANSLAQNVKTAFSEWEQKLTTNLENTIAIFEGKIDKNAALPHYRPSWAVMKLVDNDIGPGMESRSTIPYPGNFVVQAVFATNPGTLGDAVARERFSNTRYFVKEVQSVMELGTGERYAGKVKLLEPKDAMSVVDDVIEIAKTVNAQKRSGEKAKALKERLAKACETLKKDSKDAKGEDRAINIWLRRQAGKMLGRIDHPLVDFCRVGVKSGNALLDLCQASIKEYV